MTRSLKTHRGCYFYKPEYLYVGRKVMDRQVAFENLKEIVPLLDGLGIHYGPSFGTLLGIVRENDFIAWDEDIDMYVLKEDEERFVDGLWTLREHGFELVRYDKRGIYSVMRNDEYIDFYILWKFTSEVRTTGGPSFILERYLQDTADYDFKGINLRIPRDYDDFLSFQYGDWRTPVQYADFRMPQWRIFLGRIRWALKSLVPKSWYPVLFRWLRRKDWLRFRDKCARKGIVLQGE